MGFFFSDTNLVDTLHEECRESGGGKRWPVSRLRPPLLGLCAPARQPRSLHDPPLPLRANLHVHVCVCATQTTTQRPRGDSAADHGRTRTQVRERRPANLWGWRSVGGARGDSPDDHGRTRTQAHAVGHWARPTVQAHVHLGQRQRRHCCPLAELIDWRRRGADGSGEAPEMVRASTPWAPCARPLLGYQCICQSA